MTDKDNHQGDGTFSTKKIGSLAADAWQSLRQRAEAILKEKETAVTDAQEALSLENTRQAFHELQVRQIELEMQNEELHRTHVELDILRERYFDLYNLAPVGYCTLSEKGMFLEVNLTAAAMLGMARGELVGQPISRFILKEDQDIYYLHRKHLFETGHPQTCELRMVKMDGILFWATLIATAAQDEDGLPVSRIVMSDVTERKKTQEEKVRLEVLLKKAQRMKSVGRLAGGVAHDFNNMLGVILGYSEMALEQLNPDQPFHADLWEIRKAAERCADLTRHLLAFASKQIVAPKILDLNQIVEGMLKTLRQAIGEKIELAWLPGADLWSLNMDPEQIGQMLTNLCDNARDAIVGQGNITIKTENTTLNEAHCAGHPWLMPGEYVQLTVSDNGWGIDKNAMENLFEPFFTTKEMYKRSGLGLAMVYGAVKQNNGFIDVSSEPGERTTFTIYLPRYVGGKRKVQSENLVQPAPASQGTVLLVEDEPIVLELVSRLLDMKGYTVFATDSAQEAISLAREHADKIDLLLTDVLMPEMNGDELAQKLLADDPSLKCLFMSGYTADIITHSGMLDEDINFIQKPFAADNLIGKVREVLQA